MASAKDWDPVDIKSVVEGFRTPQPQRYDLFSRHTERPGEEWPVVAASFLERGFGI